MENVLITTQNDQENTIFLLSEVSCSNTVPSEILFTKKTHVSYTHKILRFREGVVLTLVQGDFNTFVLLNEGNPQLPTDIKQVQITVFLFFCYFFYLFIYLFIYVLFCFFLFCFCFFIQKCGLQQWLRLGTSFHKM